MSNGEFEQASTPVPPAFPVPPAADAPPAVAPLRKPWGFWFTLLWCLLAMGLLVGVQLLAAVPVVAVEMARQPAADLEKVLLQLETNGLFLSLSTLALAPAWCAYFALLAYLRRWPAREYLGLDCPRAGQACVAALLLVGLVAVMDGVTLLLGRSIVPEFMTGVYRNPGFLPLLVLALVVAAPLGEEVFFRGFMFRGLAASSLGGYGAVLFTSLVWSLIHLQYDLYGILQVFVGGLFLGGVRLKTGSTTLAVLLHGLMNLIATVEAAVHVALLDRGLPGLQL